MDILTLLVKAKSDIDAVVGNPLAMLGPDGNQPLIGLQLLPERRVDENQFTETRVNYKTFVANNGTRYSPVQIKGGAMVGSVDVKTVSSDIGAQLMAQDYEAIRKTISRLTGEDIPMATMMQLLKWADKALTMPLVIVNERMAMEAIVKAQYKLMGDNGYLETVKISNPPGHRVASGDWSDPTYDPMQDIYARADHARTKDNRIVRQIASSKKVTQLLNHPKVKAAARGFISVSGGALVGSENRLTLDAFNSFLAENELPPVEKYDKSYNVQGGAPVRFLEDDVWLMVGATDNTEEVEVEDGDNLTIENTLGYTAIGRNAGYDEPGRMAKTEAFDGKAPHVDGQAWQESAPVVTDPEAIEVLTDIPD